jgi:hypothetical protein
LFAATRPIQARQGAKGQVMAARQLSGWQIATLILAFSSVIAVAAVALILGKDAVIALAVILVLVVVFVSWLNC